MTKNIKIILFIIIFAVAGIAVAGMIKFNIIGDDVYIAADSNGSLNLDEFVFNTEDGKMGILYYAPTDRNKATLYIDDKYYPLKKIDSATGIKYASEDNSVVFSGMEDKTTIDINGQTSYKVAEFILIDDLDENTRRRVEVLKSNKQGDSDANKYDFGSDGVDEDTNDDTLGDNGSTEEYLDTDDDDDGVLTEDEAAKESCNAFDVDCDGDDDFTEVCNDVDNNCDDPHGEADTASDIYIKIDDIKGDVDDKASTN